MVQCRRSNHTVPTGVLPVYH